MFFLNSSMIHNLFKKFNNNLTREVIFVCLHNGPLKLWANCTRTR